MPAPKKEVADPVCGEVFPPELATFHTTTRDAEGDHRVYFCSITCKRAFDAEPDSYPRLDPEDAK